MKTALLLLFILVVSTAIYLPGLNGGFAFDDTPNIVDNYQLHVSSSSPAAWVAAALSSPASPVQRPLAMLTFAINYYFTGLNSAPMKLTNIFIHLVNTCLVFGWLRQMYLLAAPSQASSAVGHRALFASALWSFHPLNFLAVIYVVQRMESLAHLFVFAGLWLYLSGRAAQLRGEHGWTRILLGVIVLPALGALAKESAVLTPVYAMLLEIVLLKWRAVRTDDSRRLKWIFAALVAVPGISAAAYFAPSLLNSGNFPGREFNAVERLLTESRVLIDYIAWSIAPDPSVLSLYNDDYKVSRGLLEPPSTLLSLVLLAFLTAAGFAFVKRNAIVALGIFLFLSSHLLTATLIPLELVFEHRNYFGTVGACLVITEAFWSLAAKTPSMRVPAAVGATSLMLYFAGATGIRSSEWSSPLRFAATEAAKRPNSPRATYDYARNLVIVTNYQKDSPYLDSAFAAIEAARGAPSSNALPEQAALILAARTGRELREEWWTGMAEKIESQPMSPQHRGALAALAHCAESSNCDFPEAKMLMLFGAALNRGDDAEVLNIYGSYALNVLKDSQLCSRAWEEARHLKPREFQYIVNLAKLRILQQDFEGARELVVELRRLGKFGQYELEARQLEVELAAAVTRDLSKRKTL